MKIICIGRNYADHAKEMKSALPEAPVFFLKPDTALLPRGNDFFYPDFTSDLHHEIELVVRISKNGKHVEEKFAHTYFNEIGLGIDFTARDLQEKAKQKGLPWEIAKAFDNAAVVSEKFIPVNTFKNVQEIPFSLDVNQKTVQSGNSADMIFSVNKIIAYVSQFITLRLGDLIFTGTPAGVGPVQKGDILEGKIDNKKMFTLKIR